MNSTTSGFVLAAAVTVLFSTVVACVKDAYPPLKAFMKSLAGHDWTTQGLADLVLFLVLGFVLSKTNLGETIGPKRLTTILTVAVVIAALGLALWFTLF